MTLGNERLDIQDKPEVKFGKEQLTSVMQKTGHTFSVDFKRGNIEKPRRFTQQGFRLDKSNDHVTITAPTARGMLYACLHLSDMLKDHSFDETENFTLTDAPALRYRGYALGLQRPTAYFPDHKSYDWPITKDHFPWFYDRDHMFGLLDRLLTNRCNILYLWSGHPFASFLKLDDYPEMAEVSEEQLRQNQEQFQWLCREAEKRGIWVVVKFYNIHMSDPLAKARGWEIMSGKPHQEICDYTRAVLAEFVRKFPSVGLMACMGEVLHPDYQEQWLCDVILPGILNGLGDQPSTYPPVIIRAHHINLEQQLPKVQKIYPNLVTMMKHNNESLIATWPDPGNTVVARVSGSHIVNIHLMANLEPFSWGSPRFIKHAVSQILKAEGSGIHVYPLRYWDWPNSAHTEPLGDQLYENFIWWNAWGRYAWNPVRPEDEENRYWAEQLASHYGLSEDQAAALLDAAQESGPVLPQIAGQYIITSGNGQCVNLGQFTVPLAFSRQQYQDDPGYSMPQLCGFPLIGEKMWGPSPLNRMKRMQEKCSKALEILSNVQSHAVLDKTAEEIKTMRLLAEFYELKSRACARFFHILYGVEGAEESEALEWLEQSVEVYRKLSEQTENLFRDASSLYHYRRMPLPVTEGYYHWTDCLPEFEKELETAREGGIKALLEAAGKNAKLSMEWNAAALNTDEI